MQTYTKNYVIKPTTLALSIGFALRGVLMPSLVIRHPCTKQGLLLPWPNGLIGKDSNE